MFSNLLLPVDLTEPTAQLYEMIRFVYQFDCREVHLLHVLSSGTENRHKIEKRLAQRSEQLQVSEDLTVYTDIQQGHVATTVIEQAQRRDVECMYVPWRNKNFFYHTLLGSTTKDMVRMAYRPVFIYKRLRKIEKGREGKLGSIIFPTDFGEAASRAWTFIENLAPYADSLTVLHVGKRAGDPDSESAREKEVNEKLENLREEYKTRFPSIRLKSVIGSPKKRILESVHSQRADLVVMGRFNDTSIRTVFGSTSETVADKSECSVLVVP